MKLDFRTKFFMTFCVATLLISGTYLNEMAYFAFVLGLTPFILLFIEGRHKKSLILALPYVITFLISEFLLTAKPSGLNFAILIIVSIFIKMYPGLMMGYYTLTTTKMVDLVRSLQLMKLPDFLIIPISVMYRFFHSITKDYSQILKAMKLQGLSFANLYKTPVKILEYRVVPLAMCSLRAADDVTVSAMSRGLRAGNERSSISDARMKYYDYLLILLMLFFLAIYIWSHYVRN